MEGKPFRKGVQIRGARLIDIAPTILHLMGQSVPEDMDGRVLQDLFEPAFIEQNLKTPSGPAGWQTPKAGKGRNAPQKKLP